MTQTIILDCGHAPSEHGPSTTGYGVDSVTRATRCYDCCADFERAHMIETGATILYHVNGEVTDWPGHLRFKIGPVRVSRHNIAGKRYDFWFTGPDGHEWHGVRYGDMTQIAHCKRNKN